MNLVMNESFTRLKTALITLLLVGSVFIPRIPHLLGDTLFAAGTVCIFAVWLTQMILSGEITTKLTPFNNVLFASAIVALISLVISPHFLESFYAYLKLTSLILLSFVILNHEETLKLARSLFYAVVVTSALLAVAGLAEYSLGLWGTPVGGRVLVSFPNPNHFAGYLAAGMTLLALFLLDKNPRGWNKVLLSGVFVIELTALILTRSKGGILSVWCGLVLLLFWKKKRWAYGFIGFSLLTLLVILFSPLKPMVFQRELTDPFTFEKVALYKETLSYIKDHPLLGTGLETFKYYYPQYKSMPELRSAPYVHNEFLNVWTDMGLLGFGCYCWFLAVYVYSVRKILKKNSFDYGKGFIAISAGLLVHSLVEFNLHTPSLAMLLVVSGALVGSFSGERKGKKFAIKIHSCTIGMAVTWAAAVCFVTILTLPILAENYAQRGKDAYQNMNYVEAINYYSKAVKLNPLNTEILEQTAKAYFKEGTILQDEIFLWAAEHYMEKAVRLEPRNLFRYRSLAMLYKQRGKIEEAREIYAVVLKLAPNVVAFQREFALLDGQNNGKNKP